MPRFRLGEIDIYCQVRGQGRPVMLVHGLGSNHKLWRNQVGPLAARYQVLVPDLRGHGRSTYWDGECTIALFTQDLVRLLDRLDVPQAVVMGSSTGSEISLQLALDHSHRVAGLILVNPFAACDDDDRARRAEWLLVLQRGGTEALTELLIPRYFLRGSLRLRGGVIEAYRKIRLEQHPKAVMAAVRAGLDFDVRDRLHEIRVPTLLVVGERDIIMPPYHALFMKDNMPRAEYVRIEGSGHLPYLDRPEIFNRSILGFLERHYPPRRRR